ncbi:MAG TPA: NAD-dependent epimerase/dehydratase family protein [Symbiobacteriaceae bacterium]|nr:NAD-dependent epimerase/dehydratase family protein [Symbiobacteriaceae bacterium]
MRTLVTGGAGFIGSHIAQELLARQHEVIVIDDLSAGRRANLDPTVDLRLGSVLEPDLTRHCRDVDAVVHAAAQTSVANSTADPGADALTNIIGTIRTVCAAAAGGAGRFIYLSSAAVYSDEAAPPLREDSPTVPSSPYGLSKLAGEWYVRQLAGAAGMDWVILRLANVYGPRQSPAGEAGVVARWTAALLSGAPVALHGDGGQTRDFIYVGDVARAVAAALETRTASGQIFNVGTGSEFAIRDLLQMLQGLTGAQAALSREPSRPGDIRRSALQTARIRQALPWQPQTPLRDGLTATLTWMRTGTGRPGGA